MILFGLSFLTNLFYVTIYAIVTPPWGKEAVMSITTKERDTLRELAKRYVEIAALPIQTERINRGRDINDLKPRRPMVWLHELPWHEFDSCPELALTCKDDAARYMELHFRRTLYRWEHFQADMVVENAYPIGKGFTNSGMGIPVLEDQLPTDTRNYIVSHHYKDQWDTIEKVEALQEPVITAYPDADAANVAKAQEILGDILPVRLHGHNIYYAPWDLIPQYRGVMPALIDMIENPDLIHATLKKLQGFSISIMKQMEALNLLDTFEPEVHCTPPYVTDLPPGTGLKNIWFRAMGQMLTEVSPAMFAEFELEYLRPLMDECGLTYYGCCEALDSKIEMLKSVPNLRKIGVPCRSNPEICAEQIGGAYVYAHKPNPAHVAGDFDPDTVREEITRVIKTCMAHGCPYEFVLKDVSTVAYDPRNLVKWTQTVMAAIDEYYA